MTSLIWVCLLLISELAFGALLPFLPNVTLGTDFFLILFPLVPVLNALPLMIPFAPFALTLFKPLVISFFLVHLPSRSG